MSLNIKNERTHALVRQLATRTGMSQTEAVADAVSRRLQELSKTSADSVEFRVESLMSLAAEISQHLPDGAWDGVDDWLYDENGLPR